MERRRGILAAAAMAALVSCALPSRAQEFDRRILAHGRVRASNLLTVSAGAGVMRTRVPRGFECWDVCRFKGPLALVEIGASGAQVGLGWGRMSGPLRPGPPWLRDVLLGISAKGVVLRTWRGLDPPDQTLVGVEGTFAAVRGHVTLGAYRSVHPSEVDDAWQFGWGIGWGF